jgi:hypothetical protein
VGSPQECRTSHVSSLPRSGIDLKPQQSGMSHFSAIMSTNSSSFNLVKPYIFDMWIFWQSGNLNLVLPKTSITCFLFCSLVQVDINASLMWTLATVSWGLSQWHRIPVWLLSAPAQDFLLIPMMWKGCSQTLIWKPSLPTLFTMYFLTQI